MNKNKKHVYYIALTAVLAAMTTVLIQFAGIPVGPGRVHFGDAVILLAAVLLPTPYAMAVGAIGGGMHNMMFNLAMWAPATVVVKAAITVPFSAKQDKLLARRNLLALLPYWAITVGVYAVYEMLFISLDEAWTAILLRSAVSNTIQVLGSAVLFVAFAAVLQKIKFKQRIGL